MDNINLEIKEGIITAIIGETGSGKSILIGSINLALGKRASKDLMRDENEDTVVSIGFDVEDKKLLDMIREMDIDVDESRKVIIYRKITKPDIINNNDVEVLALCRKGSNRNTNIPNSPVICHNVPPIYFLKGIPSPFNKSNDSSLVLAVVTNTISIPRTLSILSYSISGKINCSFRPRA